MRQRMRSWCGAVASVLLLLGACSGPATPRVAGWQPLPVPSTPCDTLGAGQGDRYSAHEVDSYARWRPGPAVNLVPPPDTLADAVGQADAVVLARVAQSLPVPAVGGAPMLLELCVVEEFVGSSGAGARILLELPVGPEATAAGLPTGLGVWFLREQAPSPWTGVSASASPYPYYGLLHREAGVFVQGESSVVSAMARAESPATGVRQDAARHRSLRDLVTELRSPR